MEIARLLAEHDLDIESLVDTGFALYVGDKKGSELRALRERYKKLLEKNLADPNVYLLIAAASSLDEVMKSEKKGIFSSSADPAALVADELIGMSIAEYIAGKRGLFNYVRYDKAKPGVLAKLPPFMDDAIGAFVAATMTKLFEEME